MSLILAGGVLFQTVIRKNRNSDMSSEGISVVYMDGESKQQIHGFSSENTLYFFLPKYVNTKKLYLRMDSSMELSIGEETLQNNSVLADVELGRTYQAEYGKKEGKKEKLQMVFLKGSELPVIQITTASGTLDYIHSQKGNSENGYMQIRDAEGNVTNICQLKSIAGRGNTSWDASKKSYTIKLDNYEELLGMEAEKSWVLNANYYDGTYIRNQIGFELAKSFGMLYIPESRFAELYINDEYMGLYQLMETVNVSKHRVDIGNDYLLEIDYIERACEEEKYIKLQNGQPVVIHEPTKNVDVERVQEFFDEFVERMESGDIPWELIDAESFAKMFVMEEFLQDMDFGYTSHYMYLDIENRVLSEGTVWDLDNTMGRGSEREPKELFTISYGLENSNLSRWYAILYGNEDFRNLIETEYRENFRPQLEQLITSKMDEYIGKIELSIEMDQKRFPGQRSIFMSNASFEENVTYLRNYLQDKLKMMDQSFSNEALNGQVKIELPEISNALFEAENVISQEQESSGMLNMFMQYRGIFLLVVIVILGGILRYQCKRMGK